MGQNEITSPVPVLDENGIPHNFGWAKQPLFVYEPALIITSRRRVSESERYILISPTHLFITEIYDDGSIGYAGITLVSLMDKERSTQKWIIPFPLGCFELPKNSEEGRLRIQEKKYLFNFTVMDKGVRIIKIDIPHFGGRKSLRGELVLTPPDGAESMATNLPWRGKYAFRCSRRSPCYAAEGVMLYGTTEIIFTGGDSWGIYEWNRGIRPREDIRFWAAGCGKSGGRQIGFSVGYDSTTSLCTENAFFLDGKIHKLDQVTFQISPSNWLLPWHFTSNDGRLEMILAPHQERMESSQMLFHSLKRRQVIGSFSGKVILDDKTEFEFQNITGFAERRKTRF